MAQWEDLSLQNFDLFPRLPIELRLEIWRHAANARSRILQLYFNYQEDTWKVCQDSISHIAIANVCKEARSIYTRLFHAYVFVRKDIFLITDPSFTFRGPQRIFLNQGKSIVHLALTGDIWQELRHTHHDFPTATLSAAGIARELGKLETFTLAVTADGTLEVDPHNFEPGWTEDRADEWLDTGDSELADRHETVMAEMDHESPLALQADASGNIPHEAKADRFLSGLEKIAMEDMERIEHDRATGLFRWSFEGFEEEWEYGRFITELEGVFWRETVNYPSWKLPILQAWNIECGEMPYDEDIQFVEYLYGSFSQDEDIGDEGEDEDEDEDEDDRDTNPHD
jgi:hypothetical protein